MSAQRASEFGFALLTRFQGNRPMRELTTQQREDARDAIREMRAGTDRIFGRWEDVHRIQELGSQASVQIPASLARDIADEFKCREGTMPSRTDQIKAMGQKHGVTIPPELAQELAASEPKDAKKSKPNHRYNEHGERILTHLSPASDGTVITCCYDEDEDKIYMRRYDKRGKVRQEIPIDEKEWAKLSAAKVDEWSNENRSASDDDEDDEDYDE